MGVAEVQAKVSGLDDVSVFQKGDGDGLPVDAGAGSGAGIPEVGMTVRAGGDFEMQRREPVFACKGNIAGGRLSKGEVPGRQVKTMTGWGDQTGHGGKFSGSVRVGVMVGGRFQGLSTGSLSNLNCLGCLNF